MYNSHPSPSSGIAVHGASLLSRDCTAVYCGGTAVVEVLLRSSYGATAVMAVPRR